MNSFASKFLIFLTLSLLISESTFADGPRRKTKRVSVKDCGVSDSVRNESNQEIAVYGINSKIKDLVLSANMWDVVEFENGPENFVQKSKSQEGVVLGSYEEAQYGLSHCTISGRFISSEFEWTYTEFISQKELKNNKVWTAGGGNSECKFSWEFLVGKEDGMNWQDGPQEGGGVTLTGKNVIRARVESNCRSRKRYLSSDIKDETIELNKHSLSNYPEPFNPSTTLVFVLKDPGHVVADFYNSGGQKLFNIADRYFEVGRHEIRLLAGDLPSGRYIILATTKSELLSKIVTLSK